MYIITVYQNFSTFITAISACILVCKCVDYTMYVDMFKLAIKKNTKRKRKTVNDTKKSNEKDKIEKKIKTQADINTNIKKCAHNKKRVHWKSIEKKG